MDGMNLLKRARLAGFTIEVHDGRLAIKGPKRAEAIAKELLQNKDDVIAALTPAAEPALAQRPVATGTTPTGGHENLMPQAASVPCDPPWTPGQQGTEAARFGDNNQWPTRDNPARLTICGKRCDVARIFDHWFYQLAGHPKDGWFRCRNWKRLIEEQLKLAGDASRSLAEPHRLSC